MSPLAFFVLATLLITGAFGVILLSSPIRSALSLVVTLFVMAVTFLLLDAQLVAALQVVVYAGAILVLFLFVIMLLNLQEEPRAMAQVGVRMGAAFLASLLVLLSVRSFLPFGADVAGTAESVPATFGATEPLAESLFTKFLFPFEVTSLLLLVAIIGSVVLAKKSLS